MMNTVSQPADQTRNVKQASLDAINASQLLMGSGFRPQIGNALLKWHSMVVFEFEDIKLVHTLRMGKSSIIGRRSEGQPEPIDIDMTYYQAQERGVSRAHAAFSLMKNVVYLVDLDSTNGTYLNGGRLLPNQPRIVRDGDEIHLGQLRFVIRFG